MTGQPDVHLQFIGMAKPWQQPADGLRVAGAEYQMEFQAMAHARYFVTPHAGHWRVSLESRTMGKVATKTEAINSAIVMADLMGNMGHDADVMLDDGEKLAVIWTYGENTFRGSRPRKVKAPRSRSRSHVKHAAVPA